MKAKIFFLKDKISSRFAARFKKLIEDGHCPICLPTHLSSFQMDSFIQNHPDHGIYNDDVLVKESEAEVVYPFSYGTLTSGTTSTPKICFLDIQRAKANALAHGKSLGLDDSMTIIQALPIYHSFGIMNYIWLPEVMKMKIHYHDGMLGLKTIDKLNLGKCYLAISPSQLRFFLREKTIPANLAVVSVGGGLAHREELIELKEKLSCEVYVTYGLSEAGPRVSTAMVDDEYKEGSLGYPLDGIELKLDQSSALMIKTPYEKLNISEGEKEGDYLLTRDIVELEGNEIIFQRRHDDMIDFGGVSIYPGDIEKIARTYDGVVDALVLAKEHPVHGEVPVLFIESQADISTDALDAFLVEKLLPYQRPHQVQCLRQFPRTSLGKIDRQKLRGEFL